MKQEPDIGVQATVDVSAAVPFSTGSPSLIADRYEILGMLGRGGMGAVYRARDRELDEIVAIKILRADFASDKAMVERFRQEVKLARRIHHPNVVRMFDLGEHAGGRFLVMECVQGQSLAMHLERTGALPFGQFFLIARGMCAGIAAAHAAGVLHRDLKPDNVLLWEDGRVAITDFGIARAVDSNAQLTQGTLGTPAYMSPEQVRAQNIDATTDIYALGAVLFEMLTDRRAWPGQDVFAVAIARIENPPPDPRQLRSMPDDLAELVMNCMAKHASRRPSLLAIEESLTRLSAHATDATAPLPKIARGPGESSRTLAVLPLRASLEADSYLAEGLAEELVDLLSMTQGLRVRPLLNRSLGEREAQEVGRTLGVQLMVDGSMRRQADHIQVRVRLIGVEDGFQIWASRFVCREQEVLSVAETIARAIAEALTAARPEAHPASRSDPRLVGLYLRARAEVRRGWSYGDFDDALPLLREGLTVAPDDPGFLAQYALALSRIAFYGTSEDQALLTTAVEAAENARRIAPQSADSTFAVAVVRWYLGDIAGSVRAMKETVELAPSHSKAQHLLGDALMECDRIDDAIARFEVALRIDPDADQARSDLVRSLALLGEWERHDQMLQGTSSKSWKHHLYQHELRMVFWTGRPLPQRPEHLPATLGPEVDNWSATLEARRTGTASPGVDSVTEQAFATANPRLRAARMQFSTELFAHLRDFEAAFSMLEGSVAAGLHDLSWMRRCPALAPLRQSPKWPELLRTVVARAEAVAEALDL